MILSMLCMLWVDNNANLTTVAMLSYSD